MDRKNRVVARRLIITCAVLIVAVSPVAAHPVPSFSYDRTVRVRLTADGVEVSYVVELTDFTVLRDIDKLVDDAKFASLKSGAMLRDAFKESIAPLLGDRLEAAQDERPLTFECRRRAIEKDPAGDNPRYRFEFFAPWPAPSAKAGRFRLQLTKPLRQEEINLERGRIDLAFADQQGMELADRREPPTALKDMPDVDRGGAEEQQLRQLSAIFSSLKGEAPAAPELGAEISTAPPSIFKQMWTRGPAALLESNLGLGLLLVLAAGFGAAHALTPGHGKTLVAAYLVGQRGTIWHALLLGLITTITHTGIVLVLAAMLPWLLSRVPADRVQAVLGFAGGLLVAALGVWLLLRRLAGGADHIHLGGGHHHHHGPGGHHHHHLPAGDRVRGWDLIVLGISGGIVPCWDAIALLAMAIGTKQVGLGLPLLLAFSAGLAGVLVLIGVLVVKVKGFGSSRFGEGRLVRALPIVSAMAVTVLGLWLCFDSVRGP